MEKRKEDLLVEKRKLNLEKDETMETLQETLDSVKRNHQTAMRRGIKVFRKDSGFIKAHIIKLMKKVREVDNVGGLEVLNDMVDDLVDDSNYLVHKLRKYAENELGVC